MRHHMQRNANQVVVAIFGSISYWLRKQNSDIAFLRETHWYDRKGEY